MLASNLGRCLRESNKLIKIIPNDDRQMPIRTVLIMREKNPNIFVS